MISAPGFGQEAVFFVKEPTHKFPKTPEGAVVQHYFVVENKGIDTLKISQVKVACPCTKIEFPAIIPPHSKDSVLLTFDSKGTYYQQDRKIYVFTNTKKKVEELRFKVFVIPREENN